MANLNKVFMTNTIAVSKYIPKSPESASIEIPPFKPQYSNFVLKFGVILTDADLDLLGMYSVLW